ncbi:TonB family protein [Sphingomonas aracearum]|uniref:TonB family protein n=1 Tax=Sphingomonas aracearum TaxID=2283317 RepID=A0A369VUD3_9SPHN|nr:TonB family protein [Sphingomonas aracearum]RDE05984.1 TonB family protein [Sphingomonas aracearum]
MRKVLFLLAAAAAVPLTASAAQDDRKIVVVAKPISVAAWSTMIGKRINAHLVYPTPPSNELRATGVSSVAFQCSEDGRPAGVALLRKSGSRALDGAALRAVSEVRTLHPLPEGVHGSRKFRANIIFASDRAGQMRLAREVASEMAATRVAEPGGVPILLAVAAAAPIAR